MFSIVPKLFDFLSGLVVLTSDICLRANSFSSLLRGVYGILLIIWSEKNVILSTSIISFGYINVLFSSVKSFLQIGHLVFDTNHYVTQSV